MKNLFKGKAATALIILFTVILAGVAIFTALRLYQLRQTSISPVAPSSRPKAQETILPGGIITITPGPGGGIVGTEGGSCSLLFTLTQSTTSPSPTPSSTPNPPAATPNSCGGSCGSNFNCASNLSCYQGVCRNPNCTASTNCTCGGTPAPTAPSLPQSGTDWPTIVGAGVGVFVIIGSLLLAL